MSLRRPGSWRGECGFAGSPAECGPERAFGVEPLEKADANGKLSDPPQRRSTHRRRSSTCERWAGHGRRRRDAIRGTGRHLGRARARPRQRQFTASDDHVHLRNHHRAHGGAVAASIPPRHAHGRRDLLDHHRLARSRTALPGPQATDRAPRHLPQHSCSAHLRLPGVPVVW